MGLGRGLLLCKGRDRSPAGGPWKNLASPEALAATLTLTSPRRKFSSRPPKGVQNPERMGYLNKKGDPGRNRWRNRLQRSRWVL